MCHFGEPNGVTFRTGSVAFGMRTQFVVLKELALYCLYPVLFPLLGSIATVSFLLLYFLVSWLPGAFEWLAAHWYVFILIWLIISGLILLPFVVALLMDRLFPIRISLHRDGIEILDGGGCRRHFGYSDVSITWHAEAETGDWLGICFGKREEPIAVRVPKGITLVDLQKACGGAISNVEMEMEMGSTLDS